MKGAKQMPKYTLRVVSMYDTTIVANARISRAKETAEMDRRNVYDLFLPELSAVDLRLRLSVSTIGALMWDIIIDYNSHRDNTTPVLSTQSRSSAFLCALPNH